LAGRAGGRRSRAPRPAPDGERGARMPGRSEACDGAQRLPAADGGGRRDLRSAGRRPAPHVRARARPADGAALLPVLRVYVGPITELPPDVTAPALAGKLRDTLALTWEERRWTRKRVVTTGGRELALALPTGSVLSPGDVVAVVDDWYLVVE